MKLCNLLLAFLLLASPAGAVELVFMAVDRTLPDAELSERTCHKQGDLISVGEDGFFRGRDVVLPPSQGGVFARVRITGITLEQAEAYLGSHYDTDGTMLHRHLFRIRVSSLPAGVRQALFQTGLYVTTWATVKAYVQRNDTGSLIP